MVDGGHVNVLKTSPPMFSPGHCEVIEDSKGRTLMAYHFYDGRRYWVDGKWGLPRAQVRELHWSKDDWPMPGLPMEHLAITKFAQQNKAQGKWHHQADFGAVDDLELKPDQTLVSGNQKGKWSQEGNQLTLRWPKRDNPTEYWVDQLTLLYDGNFYVGRNQAGAIIRGYRQ
jgi:hypothetical protein